MNFSHFIQQLQSELQLPLPGFEVQMRMAPNPRSGTRLPYDAPQATSRQSGVLVLFYPCQDELYLLLILRPTSPSGRHSGQIGFPGGGFEEGDESIIHTALREAHEEVGIDPGTVQILGQLTPLYVFVSDNMVTPVVGWCDHRPHFTPDPREVAQVIEAPLRHLLEPTNQHIEEWQLRDRVALVPFFQVGEHKVWGATAMMLSELLALKVCSTLNRTLIALI